MKVKKFSVVCLFLFIAVASITCKHKEGSKSQKSGSSAIHKVVTDGRRTADVERLLENGADVDSRDEAGMTPLHSVAFLGHIKTARLLIKYGADVNAINDKGETPLHLAADGGQLEIVKLLLDSGAEINIETKEGKTPLDYVNKNISYWEQMLHARPVEGSGEKIASYALKQVPTVVESYKACAEVLENHGAK
jgi:hypothetical protein